MLVGSRLLDGKYALFNIETKDYKVARNTVLQHLSSLDQVELTTPILALITEGCGRDLKPSVAAHRVDATPKEPA